MSGPLFLLVLCILGVVCAFILQVSNKFGEFIRKYRFSIIVIYVLIAVYLLTSQQLASQMVPEPKDYYLNNQIIDPVIVRDVQWWETEYYQVFFHNKKVYNVLDYYPDFLDPSRKQQVLIRTYKTHSLGLTWGVVTEYAIQEDYDGVVKTIRINKVDK